MNLKKVFALLVMALLFFLMCLVMGCDTMKELSKNSQDTSVSQEVFTKKLREADSVSYRPGKVTYKDTTIYRVTKNNTRLETVYDSNGNIRDINCYAAQIEETTRENMELREKLKNKELTKETKTNFDWVIYIVIGVVVILIFAILYFGSALKKQGSIISKVAEKL